MLLHCHTVPIILLVFCAVLRVVLPTEAIDGTDCSLEDRIDLTNGTMEPGNGTIQYAGGLYDQEHYFENQEQRYSCVCKWRVCIYVCCYHIDADRCELAQLPLNVSVRTATGSRVREQVNLKQSARYWLIYARPPAWNSTAGYVMRLFGYEAELHEDGSLAYGSNVYASKTYCVNPGSDPIPFVWFLEQNDQVDVHHWHSLGMIISVPFLIATLIVYILIPDLRNIPGKSLMCYVLALTSSYVTLVVIKRSVIIMPDWCQLVGYLCYYSLMSSFFWLNVMAFDIFWTFGGRRRSTTDRGKFLLYCCYAYGVPMTFLAGALVADKTELLPTTIRPGFGDGQCLFKAEQFVSLVYLYLPLALVVSTNLFFFISTASKISLIERNTAAALRGDSGRHSRFTNERNRYGLYVRLFVVMGVTWMFELISWVADTHHWWVYVTDICNCSSGVFIFFLFVWKRKVLMLLQERLNGKKVRSQAQPLFSMTATRTTALTQTQGQPMADKTELLPTTIRPGFGDGQCLFKAEQFVSLVYLYLPLALVVSTNLLFFISTASKISLIERNTAAALRGDSGRHSRFTNERNRYGLYVRLFVVMGVTWMFELISWVADTHHWWVYVTDICNCSSGVFIFFLFVWKRKVLMLLQERLNGKKVRSQAQPLFSMTATRTTALTQTQGQPSPSRLDTGSF
ncbi:G-protein coupled receptor Mth2-like [Anopheles aquasalis]|uniref:G-protein coupled receptor Mth2-like n=1 Tax=Anopheles aquasalis TaxID=42839 RepID=UPI00215AC933|nr:G-protein coupled receptor Mth2-like [Anopheles aquasalis]